MMVDAIHSKYHNVLNANADVCKILWRLEVKTVMPRSMSKLRIMDHFKPADDRLRCNLCPKSYPKKAHRAPMLLYDAI